MALVDFIPVVLFCIGAVILQREMYDRMGKGQFALFAAGTTNVCLAGTCKALYKLLYALHICDFIALSDMFFPVQSIGFMLAGLGVIAMLAMPGKRDSLKAVAAPVVFSGTMLFVVIMCLGIGMTDIGLSVQAAKENKKKAIPFFIIAFVSSLAMGYLSSRDFSKAIYNWIAEGINSLGQAAFLAAALIYRKK